MSDRLGHSSVGLNLQTFLATQNADKAPHGVRLPLRDGHDLRQRCTFRALHHRDDLGLLVGALCRRFSGGLFGPGGFFRGLGLGFLGGRALALWLLSGGFRCRRFFRIDSCSCSSFSP